MSLSPPLTRYNTFCVTQQNPVSYTHLDVYKRQPCNCTGCEFSIFFNSYLPAFTFTPFGAGIRLSLIHI
ncbi:hypothetical protein [Erwinia amylovora]